MSVFSPLCKEIVDFGTKNSNPRTEKISKITIHHMAIVCSAADCARGHLRSSGSSANYYVGNDGTICGGVSEDRRAWTSDSPWNDQRAITIEVSNSVKAEPWPVSDAAYKATITLCADICQRYNISPRFTGDKNGTLTMHCMFKATACPGPTWKERLKNGTVERNIREYMETIESPKVAPVQPEEQIWKYFKERIGNDYGVAGLMGNLYAESGLRPNNLQNSFEKKLGMTDEQYTAAVDSGAYTKEAFIRDGAGMGIAQWTFWSRKENLYNFKGSRSIGDLQMQLEFLYEELKKSYGSVLSGLKLATSIYEASTLVLTQFEKPADQSEAVKQTRASYSQVYYDRYGKGRPTPSGSYIVRIIADELNVRKGPGTDYDIVRTVVRGEAFTITQTVGDWGFLKSGIGWINLRYTERV